MRYFYLLAILSFGVLFAFWVTPGGSKEVPYYDMAYIKMYENQFYMHDKYKLEHLFVGGKIGEKISNLNIGLDSPTEKSIEELREMMVDGVETFISKVNSEPGLEGRFLEDKFEVWNVFYGIYYDGGDLNRNDGVVNVCILKDSKIRYATSTSQTPVRSEDLLIESYEDAKMIIMNGPK